MFNRIKCMFSHEWNDWLVTEENPCIEFRICQRCENRETRNIPHAWTEWEMIDGQCVQSRICQKCNEAETESVPHIWEEWQASVDACLQYQNCQRCGEQQSQEIPHQWNDWAFVAEANCFQLRQCQHCSQKEERYQHQFSEWRYINEENASAHQDYCQQKRDCERCRDHELRQVDHVWGKWEYETPRSCNMITFCINCQQKAAHEAEFNQHDWQEPQYQHIDSCDSMFSTCRRCGMQDDSQGQHKWGDWQLLEATKRRICGHCAEVEELPA